MKKLAIALSIFPGTLLVLAIVSCPLCSFAERNLPPGGVDIGLSLVLLAALINIPALAAWLVFFTKNRGGGAGTPPGAGGRNCRRWVSLAASLAVATGSFVLTRVTIAATTRTEPGADAQPVASLEQWEKRTRRPAFTLLDRADLPEYFVCVYETGLGEVAFCYLPKKPDVRHRHSFAVRDTQDKNLQDPARWNKVSDLNQPGDTVVIPGMVIPIRPDFRGEMQLEFKADRGSGYQSVYKKSLPYDRDRAQGGVGRPAVPPDAKPAGLEKP